MFNNNNGDRDKVVEMRKEIESLMDEDYKLFVKSLISLETEIEKDEVLDKVVEEYLTNDHYTSLINKDLFDMTYRTYRLEQEHNQLTIFIGDKEVYEIKNDDEGWKLDVEADYSPEEYITKEAIHTIEDKIASQGLKPLKPDDKGLVSVQEDNIIYNKTEGHIGYPEDYIPPRDLHKKES